MQHRDACNDDDRPWYQHRGDLAMSADVVTEMTRLWSKLREDVDSLDARSPEAKIEIYLERLVVLGGVEAQTVYDFLEDEDDDSDAAIKKAKRRWNKIQKAMENLHLPPNERAWRAFADAVIDHLDKSPKDIGARLEALSKEDRAELGTLTKSSIETLS
jgi:hypothetical protein